MDIALSKPKSFKRTVRNYKNVNVNGLIAALLNANWNDVFINSLDTIDSVYDKCLNLLNYIIDVYIPSRS